MTIVSNNNANDIFHVNQSPRQFKHRGLTFLRLLHEARLIVQQVLLVIANDAFGGLRAVIDEAMNVLWTMLNGATVTDETLDARWLLMYI